MKYAQVQQIAKDTIEYIKSEIVPGMYLTDIRHLCEEKIRKGKSAKMILSPSI